MNKINICKKRFQQISAAIPRHGKRRAVQINVVYKVDVMSMRHCERLVGCSARF